MILKHGDRNDRGERWDRPSHAWVSADEWQARQWDREERAFQRRANQGELATPSVIMDGMPPVKSMIDGKMYDSKATIRAHYRRENAIELGNEHLPIKPPSRLPKDQRMGKIATAMKRAGIWDQLRD